MIGLAVFMIAGCNRNRPPGLPAQPPETAAQLAEVTLYVANMNRELKIL